MKHTYITVRKERLGVKSSCMLFYEPGFLRPATIARQCVWHNKKVHIEAQHNPITLYESSGFDDLTSVDFDHSLTIQLIKNDTYPSE